MIPAASFCPYYTLVLECEIKNNMVILSVSKATVRELDLRYPQRYPHRPGGAGFGISEGIAGLVDAQRRSLVHVLTRIPEPELLHYVVEVTRGGRLLETWDFRKAN